MTKSGKAGENFIRRLGPHARSSPEIIIIPLKTIDNEFPIDN